MSTISWDEWYYNICIEISKKSHCMSRQIGAILVKDKSIIAQGYNGPPRGIPHCDIRHKYDPLLLNEYHKHGLNISKESIVTKCPRQLLGFESGEGLLWCCLDGKTKIHLLNGESKEIQELYKTQKEGWVFATDVNTLEIVPAKYTNIFMNGIRNDMIELQFDNNSTIRVTEDHLIMMRDGSYKKAINLKSGNSIMPLYITDTDGYNRITNQKTKRNTNTPSINVEDLVYNYFNRKPYLGNDFVIHHIDKNKKNNELSNLELMSKKLHSKLHLLENDKTFFSKGGKKCIEKRKQNYDKFIKECKIGGTTSMNNNWKNETFINKMKNMRFEICRKGALVTNVDKKAIYSRAKGRILKRLIKLIECSKETIKEDNYENIAKKFSKNSGKGYGFYKKHIIEKYFNSINEALLIAKTNHKIINVTQLKINTPVYDLQVPNFNNFAVDLGDNSGIFVHNCAGHAERNTLINAARNGIVTKDAKLYMSCNIPCSPCMIEIINAGIEEIIITDLTSYDITAQYLLDNSNIKYRIFNHLKDKYNEK